MPDWRLKAGAQKVLSLLPDRLYDELLYRGGSLTLAPEMLRDRFSHAARHFDTWNRHFPGTIPSRVLEFGTGWVPVVPLGLWLCGCDQVFSTDLRNHFRPTLFDSLLQSLHQANRQILQETLPDLRKERLSSESLKTVLDFISLIKNDLHTPPTPLARIHADARHLPLSDQSVDLIVSNNTLEHIPASVIPDILRSFHRVLRPGGLMSHHIDMADHYSYFDSGISPWHFLRYSPLQWSLIENRLQSQNRLRVSQFCQMMEAAGFEILRMDNDAFDKDHFRKQPLHPIFAAMAPEDAGVLHTHIVTRRRDLRTPL